MGITAWLARFLFNLRSHPLERRRGVLKKGQLRHSDTEQLEQDKHRLNLEENESCVLACKERIQGEYPTYFPPTSKLVEKIVMHEHVCTLHGGVGMTMAAVRKCYWIPRLRQLTKKVRINCNGCKRFQEPPLPPTGKLPKDRTQGKRPFQAE
jgi:hypothetical protein